MGGDAAHGKWNKLGCRKLHAKYPGLIKKIGPDGYMDPENPRTATYLADICEEITRNYDVDGIHLDYIRYPETWKMRVSASRGRQNITSIVRNIHDKVKRLKPWVKMSCSPIGKFDDLSRYWSHGWNAYTKVCQDAQGWLRDGLMDELFPMMYFRNDQFFPFAIDWAEQSHGKIVAPGLGIYFLDPKEGKWNVADVTREMEVLRQYGLGHAFFRGRFFTDNIQGIYDFAKRFNASLALVPPMTWQSASAPNAPTAIEVCSDGLAWEGDTPYYNVYSSRTWPVDTHAAENLIAIRRAAHSLKVNTHDRFFAVRPWIATATRAVPCRAMRSARSPRRPHRCWRATARGCSCPPSPLRSTPTWWRARPSRARWCARVPTPTAST